MTDTKHVDTTASVATERARKVLIVDDDDEIRHLLRVLFELEGFDVVAEAADGPNGVVLAMRHEPDFIVLDYRMPRMDGAQTAHLLKVMTPGARIVAFSAILTQKPEWADAFLDKERMAEVVPTLRVLAESFA